jgi:uncharacterized protein (UPF0212 family)
MAREKCPDCGKDIDANAQKCPYCGYHVAPFWPWVVISVAIVLFLLYHYVKLSFIPGG